MIFRYILGALLGLMSMNLVTDLLPLPNNYMQQFLDMSETVMGVVSICIISPVIEEIIFRKIFIGMALRAGVRPLIAIFLSALSFGIIHGNPQQIPFAIVAGIIFGHIYCRTRQIWLTIVIHIVNNAIGVMQMRILGNDIFSFTFHGYLGVPIQLLIIIFTAFCSAYLLRKK